MEDKSTDNQRITAGLYEKILENSNELFSISDLHGHFLYISPALARQLCLDREVIYRMSMFDIFFDPDKADIAPYITASAISIGETYQMTLAYRSADERYYSLRASVSNMLGDNDLNGILIRYYDPRELIAGDYHFNEVNLRAVFESANDGFIITDRDFTIQTFNTIARDQIRIHSGGLELKEGVRITDYLSPDGPQQFEHVLTEIISGGEFNDDWTYGNEDGTKWTQYCVNPVKLRGEIIGLCIVGRDITEAKKAENKLRLSEERYRALIREGSDLINIVDFEGNYIHITAALKSVLDTRSVGKSAFDLVHPEDREQLRVDFEKLKHTRRVKSAPYRFQAAEGKYFWIETVGTNLMDDPAVQGIVINSHDVTDTMNHIRQIEHRNTLLEEIAWVQSHLVRAPLARILGIIEILKSSPADLNELLPHLESSATELDQVIMDITQKSRELEDI